MKIVNNVWFGVKTSFCASKMYFLLKCIVLLSSTFAPLCSIWLWKEILNELANEFVEDSNVIFYLIIYLFIKIVTYIIAKFDSYVNSRYRDEVQFYIEGIMIDKTSRVDLAFFDSASMGDKIRHTRNSFFVMTDMTWQVFNIISEIINIIATFYIVSTYKLWIGIVTIFLMIPFIMYNNKVTNRRLEMEKEQVRDNRKMDYYYSVFFDNNTQFEIRLNNVGSYFIKLYEEIWSKLFEKNKRRDIKDNIGNIFFLIVNLLSELLVLVVSVLDVISNNIEIGDLQYNLSMVKRLREQASKLMVDINQFLVNNTRISELQEFTDIKPEFEKSGKLIPTKNPKIEFCNVSFKYPNSEQYVLKNCSFTIESHEKVGLIGLNGSGKSTIIKLLFRFYDPNEGIIKFDGVDLKEYDIYEVRKVFGVLFQDYVMYSLPLREIIALSDFDERYNDEKIKKVCDISGVTEIIKNWDKGYDSVLGRNYADDGKDLSGGQWQLVGLARAYFKDSDYMILDEPSAALDPIAEDKIFKQLYELSENKSSVTISHRLSNTILADKLLYVEDGHIIEQGSHSELLRMNGQYAHLFRLQADKYV